MRGVEANGGGGPSSSAADFSLFHSRCGSPESKVLQRSSQLVLSQSSSPSTSVLPRNTMAGVFNLPNGPITDMYDIFNLSDGSSIDIAGIVMFVSPIDHDTYFPLGMREVAVVDSSNHIVFLRMLDELAERYREELLVGERQNSFVMATSMKVDQSSRSLLSTAATTLSFDRCSACHQFDMLEGVREQIHNDTYYLEVVKNVVLLRRDSHKPDYEYNAVELPAQPSTVKYIYNYLMHSTPDRASPYQVDKIDPID